MMSVGAEPSVHRHWAEVDSKGDPRSDLTVDLWDRDTPHCGDAPSAVFTAEDAWDHVASAGLSYDQVRELQSVLARWLTRNEPPRPRCTCSVGDLNVGTHAEDCALHTTPMEPREGSS